jgi:RES domain-containing protein
MITWPGSGQVHFWRLDQKVHAKTWNSGIGAEAAGGRWNSKGVKVVYASADPATAILEVAVHKTFRALDTVPHVITGARVLDPSLIHRVDSETLPNPGWLIPGVPSAGQQQFGDDLLAEHPFVLIPSSVSRYSWNLLVNPELARDLYEVVVHEPFALDTRLHPPTK